MGGGAGGGGGIGGWGGWGRGEPLLCALRTRRRVQRQLRETIEAELRERGLAIPPRMVSSPQIYAAGFVSGLLLGLLVGLIFWELT